MSHLTPLLTLRQSPDAAIDRVTRRLQACGFQVEQTFDLQAARLSHADCPCPNHGTQACTCQMVVLVVSGETPPATIILHGHDDQTWLSLGDGVGHSVSEKLAQVLLPVGGMFDSRHQLDHANRHGLD
ncbi:MAG: hypothetical protein AB1846_17120 [Chloroflexota bacterium]